MEVNKIENCTHDVPPNEFGIFAMHSFDNIPLPQKDVQNIFDGPIALVRSDLQRELARVDDEGTLVR